MGDNPYSNFINYHLSESVLRYLADNIYTQKPAYWPEN